MCGCDSQQAGLCSYLSLVRIRNLAEGYGMTRQRHPFHSEEAHCPDTTSTKRGLPRPVRSIKDSSVPFNQRFSTACEGGKTGIATNQLPDRDSTLRAIEGRSRARALCEFGGVAVSVTDHAAHEDGGGGLKFRNGDRGRMGSGVGISTKVFRNRPTTNQNEPPP